MAFIMLIIWKASKKACEKYNKKSDKIWKAQKN